MKSVTKNLKVLYYDFNKKGDKVYHINVFKKDGTFVKHNLNGEIFCKGNYKFETIDPKVKSKYFVTFNGKIKNSKGLWKNYIASFITNYTSSFKAYNGISVPKTSNTGMVKTITNEEYNKIMDN